jgi:sugar lactone lactonase YvrE
MGEIFVSDGYGNSRVHKYSPDGKLLFSWGEPGCDPGQFNIVHNICTDKDGWVYVADRENHRVQVFDGNGKYETQWNNMHRPCALYMDTTGRDPICYVGELGPGMGINKDCHNLGNRVDIYDKQGKRLARLGDIRCGEAPGQFIAPHGIALDSRGDIYVAEVSWTIMGQHLEPQRELRSLQKLSKLG